MLKRKICEDFSKSTCKKAKKLPVSPPLFNYPCDVLKWMKKNATPKVALKLMQICKYFQFQEFPYFVVKCLSDKKINWNYLSLIDVSTYSYRRKYIDYKNIDLDNFTKKLWITEKLYFNYKKYNIQYLLPKIAICDIKFLHLSDQRNIRVKHFEMLTAGTKITTLNLWNTICVDDSNKAVPLENILKNLLNIQKVYIEKRCNSFFSHQIATDIVPKTLQSIKMVNISRHFNIEECLKFLQKNQQIHLIFWVYRRRCTKFNQQIQSYVDYVITSWSPKYKQPDILFQDQTMESSEKLKDLKRIFNEK